MGGLVAIVAWGAFELGIRLPDATLVCAARATPFAVPLNPAALVLVERRRVGISHCTLYNVRELPLDVLGGALRCPVPLGLAISNLGLGAYQEQALELCVVPCAAHNIALGLGLGVMSVAVRGAVREWAPRLTAGLLYTRPRVAVGSFLENVNRGRFGGGDRLPTRFVAGVWGWPVPLLGVGVDYSRSETECWAAGVELRLVPALDIRLGARTSPLTAALGVDVVLGPATVTYAGCVHPVLGVSHLAGIGLGR